MNENRNLNEAISGASNPFIFPEIDSNLVDCLRSGMFVRTMGGEYGVVAGDKIVFENGKYTERKCFDTLLYARDKNGNIVKHFSIGAVYSSKCHGFNELREKYFPVLWSRTLM